MPMAFYLVSTSGLSVTDASSGVLLRDIAILVFGDVYMCYCDLGG